jgi:hypothetical protein
MRLLVLLFLLALSVAAQQDFVRDDAKALLLEVRKKVMLTVDRLPKYLCTETIDRSSFRPSVNVIGRSCDDLASRKKEQGWSMRQYSSDRLRLDVAISGNSEMYSWAGEARFHDRSLADLVGGGATSTGAFASFLTAIFGTDAADFTYDGDAKADGRALVAFGFRVPLEKSGYRIGTKRLGAIVGYDGTFLADKKTFDLVRMTIRADRLPKVLNACADITTLDYGNVRLNNSDFLLPKDARLQVLYADGSELDNRTVFSGCHEFLGESSLQFGDASQAEQGAAQKTVFKALALPSGLSFTIALTRAIDTAIAAAGDPIKADLESPIKDSHRGMLVPKGAAVTGRIIQIKRSYGPTSESLTLAIRLETIEANGAPQWFDARLESVVKRSINSTDSSVVRRSLGSFDQMFDLEDPSVGFLEFPDVTRDYVIKRGVEIEGVTAAPK